ncbi:four helix bundle protein [Parabacteroides sp. PFB2-12]|uniref:four helix bundle protein n=1 Tax=unclassified Parabacteroides TaxID=2649774 RepID=UPI00247C5821|nr:four helix bundle protein [Parabacteroides sp. PM6-13]MDH6389788.1 four helix bundle protein [Parabacteroides sp. PFB2-12]
MKNMKENVVREKSFAFALRIVKLFKYLTEEKKEYILSKQLIRSGTAIGALQSESENAESEADFIHKLAIAQKECNETLYWLKLLYYSDYLDETAFQSIYYDAEELKRIITAIVRTTKERGKKGK